MQLKALGRAAVRADLPGDVTSSACSTPLALVLPLLLWVLIRQERRFSQRPRLLSSLVDPVGFEPTSCRARRACLSSSVPSSLRSVPASRSRSPAPSLRVSARLSEPSYRIGAVTRPPGPPRAPNPPGTSGQTRNDPSRSHFQCPAGPAWRSRPCCRHAPSLDNRNHDGPSLPYLRIAPPMSVAVTVANRVALRAYRRKTSAENRRLEIVSTGGTSSRRSDASHKLRFISSMSITYALSSASPSCAKTRCACSGAASTIRTAVAGEATTIFPCSGRPSTRRCAASPRDASSDTPGRATAATRTRRSAPPAEAPHAPPC